MLERKATWELDEKEINLFHRAVETDEHSGSVEDVSDAIFTGELQLWVWKQTIA